jgi:hypothetical protein
MFKRTRDLLTFANVCSFVALAVALSTGGAYAANTVFSTDIVDGEVKTQDLAADAVTSPKILDGGVKVTDINADAVTSNKINDGGVQTVDLADGGVTGQKVADDSLGAADLGFSSVGSSEIATDAVNASEIADNSIDGGEIIDNSLTTTDLKGADVSGSVSFSAGAVANGRCRDFSVNSSGSTVGDGVLMSLRGAVAEGIVFSGVRVAVNGQSIIKMCNFTGGASPAITNLAVRLITFD